jgi:hypothetical protein
MKLIPGYREAFLPFFVHRVPLQVKASAYAAPRNPSQSRFAINPCFTI